MWKVGSCIIMIFFPWSVLQMRLRKQVPGCNLQKLMLLCSHHRLSFCSHQRQSLGSHQKLSLCSHQSASTSASSSCLHWPLPCVCTGSENSIKFWVKCLKSCKKWMQALRNKNIEWVEERKVLRFRKIGRECWKEKKVSTVVFWKVHTLKACEQKSKHDCQWIKKMNE